MVDYKGILFPTKEFQDEQFRVNRHQKNIINHKTDDRGK